MNKTLLLFLGLSFASCSVFKNTKSNDLQPTIPAKNYLIGIGNEPFWSLKFSNDEIRFSSIDTTFNVVTKHVKPTISKDQLETIYSTKSKEGQLIIKIRKGDCSDTMSEIIHTHSMTVQVKSDNYTEFTTFKGCGDYVK